MRFVLELEIGEWDKGKIEQEMGRILRYWAGNLKHYQLVPGDEADIYDSEYKPVGKWRIAAGADDQ